MISQLFIAIRVKTLSASLAPILVATALVAAQKIEIQWGVSLLCFLGALLIQISTNLINDVIDYKKGADTSERLGPVRVTASQAMTPRAVMGFAILFLILAVLCGVPLVIWGGWPIFAIGLVSLFLAYSYTGGPFPLAYLGLGDLFVILFFGVIAVGGTYYLLTGIIFSYLAVVAGLQVGFLSTILIAINNFRDIAQDKKANKKTLAVRFGPQFVRYEILLLTVSVFLLSGFWLEKGWLLAALLPFILVYPAFSIVADIFNNAPSEKFNSYLVRAAKFQMLFCIQLSMGLFLELWL